MNKKLVLGSLLLIFLVVVGKGLLDDRKSVPLNTSPQINWVPPQTETLTLIEKNESCYLDHNNCTITLPDGHILALSIDPKPIQPNKDLQIQAKTLSSRYKPIAVDLEGINLNMGFIRPPFSAQPLGLYTAKLNLPICDEKRMSWKALVIMMDHDQPEKQKAVQFLFNSEEP